MGPSLSLGYKILMGQLMSYLGTSATDRLKNEFEDAMATCPQ